VWDGVTGVLEDELRRRTGLYHAMYAPGRVLAPDLPGHGSRYCKDDPTRLSFEGAVQSLLAAVEAAGLSRPVVAAHDLSGLIALEVARRLKEPPRGLVFVGASVPDLFHNPVEMLPIPTRAVLNLLRFVPGTPLDSVNFRKEVTSLLLCHPMPLYDASARVVARLKPIPLRPFDALPNPETLEPRCPVTYAVLKRDWYLLPYIQREMAATFPGARVVELDCGHEAPVTHPREVAELLLAHA
jgi:pimeloyl-ACP methyl ester carboxylesterase